MASFNLSNLADRISTVISQNANISTVFGKNDRAIRELFSNISNGETILGKILSVSSDSFQISTLDNLIINAKAEKGIELTPGNTVLFEVNKFADNKISLRPLYLNTNYEETAKRALNEAGISENPRSLELVARNMEYGNPIDRNSLLYAYKDILTFEDAPVKYIVDLNQMGIEVNTANLDAFENYMNMKNLISDSFDEISKGVVLDLEDLFQTIENHELDETVLSNGISMKNFDSTLKTLDSFISFSNKISGTDINIWNLNSDEINELISLNDKNGLSSKNLSNLLNSSNVINAGTVLEAALKDIRETVMLPFEEEGSNLNEDNEALANTVPEKNVLKPDFKAFIKSESFSDLISRAVFSRWSLDEEKISSKTEIKNLYNKLYSDAKELIQLLSGNQLKTTHVSGMVDNLTKNIDFMEQINHYIPYVQIPYSSENGTNSGELYVYRNRKKLTDGDSEITAFLHLDMENLGPTDIYVSLKYNNVSTNFKLANDEALSLINDNIAYLDKRLADKGYSLKAELVVDDKRKPALQEMLFNSENHLIISKNSFDARV